MSHSIKVRIDCKEEYDIGVGTGLWDELRTFCNSRYANRKVLVVMDENLYRFYAKKVKKELLGYFKSCHIIRIPEGEQSKSIAQWEQLQQQLLKQCVERGTPLVAIGGGVTGDIAGFAAASVLRGIPLIHMPTSLLAMVDSSIGGKTGVNHPVGKNLVGAFYQPDAVFVDTEFLKTLPRKEWINGLAEMLKYAAIKNPEMFRQLEQAVDEGFQPSPRWTDLIQESASIKVDVVQQDIHEAGKRAYLNFGHTFGHALEKLAGYGKISHGEAVFVGMQAAVHFSKQLGAPVDEVRFAPFKALYHVNLPDMNTIPELIDAMKYDKKVKDETIRLILLQEWGTPYISKSEDREALHDAWQTAFEIMYRGN